MVLVAQGAVQVKREAGKTTIFIDAISDYKVRHKGTNYTVFVSDRGNDAGGPPDAVRYLMLPAEQPFKVDDASMEALVQAAVHQLKIEIELPVTDEMPKVKVDGEYTISGLRVPAPPVTK